MKNLLLAAMAVLLLVLGAAVPALAIQTEAWEQRRVAGVAFQAAADAALEASSDAAAAAPGYFTPAVLDPLSEAITRLDESLAAEAPDGLAMPSTEEPESTDTVRAATEPLADWPGEESERAVLVDGMATRLAATTAAARDAVLALVETVGAEASAALAAAPLAAPESRAAVETARDALTTAAEEGSAGEAVEGYAAAVAALRASQEAEAAAAAQSGGSGQGGAGSDAQDLLREGINRFMQEKGCVPISADSWDCPIPF